MIDFKVVISSHHLKILCSIKNNLYYYFVNLAIYYLNYKAIISRPLLNISNFKHNYQCYYLIYPVLNILNF